MKIIFFGTSDFSAKILEHLIQNHISIQAIVTQPDKAKHRSSKLIFPPVKQFVQENSLAIPIFQPEKASNLKFVEEIKKLNPDLMIVVAYGQILKKELLDIPRVAPINIHASLLPKYRGAAPIQRCLMQGDGKTGITIIKMNAEMDAGEVIAKQEFSIDQNITFQELEKKMIGISNSLLIKVIDQFKKGSVVYSPQDAAEVTFAPKILKEDMKINWKASALQVHNLIRSLSLKPGAWCVLKENGNEKKIKILLSKPLDLPGNPGEIKKNHSLIIGCGFGSIEVLLLQSEGKKMMKAEEWLRGMGKKKITFH